MEETVVPKRPREETQVEEYVGCEQYSKRHKPYNHILSLLESKEEESTQDLSPLITTLQQEITSCASNKDPLLNMCPPQENEQHNLSTSTAVANLEDCSTSITPFSTTHSDDGILKEEEDEGNNDKEKVMRHLLEASDDELGIPNAGDGFLDFGEDGLFNSGSDGFSSLCNGLWELEDETANYYALLQSALFL